MFAGALEYPLASEIHPDSVAIDTSSGTAPRLAIAGYRLTMIFDGPDQESTIGSPIANDPDAGFVTALVSFKGRFLATTTDVEASEPLFPPLHEWQEDTKTWQQLRSTVTQPSAMGARSATATPPSPPWEGASGVLHMAANGDVVWATGWATLDGQVRSVLWRSANGVDWVIETLPSIGEGTEYGFALLITEEGMAVSIGNWTYFGTGIIAREHGGEWFDLPFPPDAGGTPRLVVGATEGLAIEQNQFDGPGVLYRFDEEPFSAAAELDAWQKLAMDNSPRPIRAWSTASVGGPIAWTDPDHGFDNGFAHQWRAENADFFTAPAPADFVATDQGWTVLQANGRILLLPAG